MRAYAAESFKGHIKWSVNVCAFVFYFFLYILQGVSVKGRFRCFSQLKWPLPPRQQVLNEGFPPLFQQEMKNFCTITFLQWEKVQVDQFLTHLTTHQAAVGRRKHILSFGAQAFTKGITGINEDGELSHFSHKRRASCG